MTGSYKKQFLLKKYFIGSVECATMGKCKNQEIKNAVSVTCLVALVLVCVGIYIVNCGKEKVGEKDAGMKAVWHGIV